MSDSRKNYHRGRKKQQVKETRKSEKGGNGLKRAGFIIILIQLMVSVLLVATIGMTGFAPMKYLVIVGGGLLFLFLITFSLQFGKKKAKIVGIVFSLLFSVIVGYGIYFVISANNLAGKVSGGKYKTDNMVVVVKDSDPAKTLKDAKDYTFGYQIATDAKNNGTMISAMEEELESTIATREYNSLNEVAEAVLSGEVKAAFYNEGYGSMLEDTIEGYSGQVRVIYQHGIHTEVKEEEVEKDVSKAFTVYISGIDVSGPITTNSRSDVNILMTINPDTKKVLLTTTPRDFYVTIPEVSGDARDKLTHAGIYGVDASMRTLSQLYDIPIQYYARVNFDSLIQIVDAVGGVEVYSEETFVTEIGGYQINEGMNQLDGQKALGYVRERYALAGGDVQRGINQQKVITAIFKKMLSPTLLTNFGQILGSVEGSVQTNMTKDEMSKLVNDQLATGGDYDIQSASAIGTGDEQPCFSSGAQPLYVMWPDENVINDIKAHMKEVIGE